MAYFFSETTKIKIFYYKIAKIACFFEAIFSPVKPILCFFILHIYRPVYSKVQINARELDFLTHTSNLF